MKIYARCSGQPLEPADLLAVGCFENDKRFLDKCSSLDVAAKEKIYKRLSVKKFKGTFGDVFLVPGLFFKTARSLLLIGVGKKEGFSLDRVRRLTAKSLSQTKLLQAKSLRLDLDTIRGNFSLADIAGAAVCGARLATYRFDKYKSKPSPASCIENFELFAADKKNARVLGQVLAEAEVISTGVFLARNLANEPANVMTPQKLAQSAKAMASKHHLTCQVLGKSRIKRLGMGGLLAVSQGSIHEPQFIILENHVKSPKFSQPLVLVGKGITFDTGGISIKPSNDMDKMKFDMCGAAAVMGVMQVIADLKLPIKVVALAPVCENMPGAGAQRPGDIIRCMNGKTVEILNTDAEGRLILADALSYAARYKPKAVIDIATLTGACAATFADLAIGLMGTDAELVRQLKAAGEATGERCWELPLWEAYADLIKATYADIQNISKKYAGTITSGMFLKEFADHTPSWAHLDVAGTAWNEGGAKPLSPIGATGVGVRLLVELIKSYL
ncbi:MAG: leucyl aminopeptidase [Candidatus Omnitrophica bacterium CG07_land_8_20_14_0_80_50_8]|nr:MAG: leucyl aminopeptidase [Candidatus Omnitrophica bacterium CG07_land_8_20_14_0_80_50_8]